MRSIVVKLLTLGTHVWKYGNEFSHTLKKATPWSLRCPKLITPHSLHEGRCSPCGVQWSSEWSIIYMPKIHVCIASRSPFKSCIPHQELCPKTPGNFRLQTSCSYSPKPKSWISPWCFLDYKNHTEIACVEIQKNISSTASKCKSIIKPLEVSINSDKQSVRDAAEKTSVTSRRKS